jgi:hypothetical protein
MANLKVRKNIVLSPTVVRQGKRVGRVSRRNFSNLVEHLVTQEHERLFGKNVPAPVV